MSEQFFPVRGSVRELRDTLVVLLGTGASDPTKVHGLGITAKWISTGLYELTWGENPYNFVGLTPGWQATTASALKGYSAVAGVFNATTLKLRISVTNASDALTDLAALQWLTLRLSFEAAGTI